MGEADGRLSVRGSIAICPDVRSTLPGWRLRDFLVLDFLLRASVRQQRAPARRLGAPEGQLFLYCKFHYALALDSRAAGGFGGVLGFRRSAACIFCLRVAHIFFRRGVPGPLLQAALLRSIDARGCHFNRGGRYIEHPPTRCEIQDSLAWHTSRDGVCRRVRACDSAERRVLLQTIASSSMPLKLFHKSIS